MLRFRNVIVIVLVLPQEGGFNPSICSHSKLIDMSWPHQNFFIPERPEVQLARNHKIF